MSDKKAAEGVQLKKDWLRCRFDEGLTFRKLDARGKVFIEYIPAEYAWVPVEAEGYMYINCLWVAGSFKGQGYGRSLLDACMSDSKNKHGLITISSKSKKPYLSDKKFLLKQGFETVDTAPPYFELMVKRLGEGGPVPRFKECAKQSRLEADLHDGLVVCYTSQCPFTEYYANQELEEIGREYGIPVKSIRLASREEAQNAPAAWTTYSAYYNGTFITHEILNRAKFSAWMKKRV
ncbi:GNAT family N-acetyltransferase [Paenibacillus sambharensis]|uniref:GNAT family N-acetyltransferase n=2 Tax=Paenibacillus sambharensis TaxID=1803190 RepID=A0A2W1LPI3_9BACL|nr:GNAT family N-acetyltransferase [Paenibacillus sambharensis]PZD93741.1 GNAT family N-acetyltransferase [Paenibacillus sambharensis]